MYIKLFLINYKYYLSARYSPQFQTESNYLTIKIKNL